MQHPILRRPTWLPLVLVLGVGLAISISACAPAGTAGTPQSTSTAAPPQSTSTSTSTTQGTVNGLVVASPSCPVEREDQPCPPKPVPDRVVMIETTGGKVVTHVTTDQKGRFTVTLASGTYDLQVLPGSSQYPAQRQRQQVTVIAGKTVQVQVMLDSGIR